MAYNILETWQLNRWIGTRTGRSAFFSLFF